MFQTSRILVMLRQGSSSLTWGRETLMAACCQMLLMSLMLIMMSGCGQQGALYLPTEAAAANRATLPQTLIPSARSNPAAVSPAPAASSARP